MNIRSRQTSGLNYLAALCFAAVLLSTTVQAAHFCGLRPEPAQTAIQADPASSGSPSCLICLMAPSSSAIILLVAFVILSRNTAYVGGLQMRLRPILDSFGAYIRPPPLA